MLSAYTIVDPTASLISPDDDKTFKIIKLNPLLNNPCFLVGIILSHSIVYSLASSVMITLHNSAVNKLHEHCSCCSCWWQTYFLMHSFSGRIQCCKLSGFSKFTDIKFNMIAMEFKARHCRFGWLTVSLAEWNIIVAHDSSIILVNLEMNEMGLGGVGRYVGSRWEWRVEDFNDGPVCLEIMYSVMKSWCYFCEEYLEIQMHDLSTFCDNELKYKWFKFI